MKIKILLLIMVILIIISSVWAITTSSNKSDKIVDTTGIDQNKRYFISNAEFTNQNWAEADVYAFVKTYPRNRLTKKDISIICDAARSNTLNPLVMLTKMEQEQSMVRNMCHNANVLYAKRYRRAMAYGLSIKKYVNGKKYYPHEGYYKQVTRGAKCLRKFYDIYKEGISHPINYGKDIVHPKNAATYSLYVYCPFYGLYKNHGITCRGNVLFIGLYNQFKERWNNLHPKLSVDKIQIANK